MDAPGKAPFKYSLEDFYLSDSDDVLAAPSDFDEWLSAPESMRCFALFEQQLLGAPLAVADVRSNIDGQAHRVINLSSYNYLGLSAHPEVIAAAKQALDTYGLGAAGAPLLSGTFDLHREFADKLAGLKRKEDCVLYPTGLMGNYGAMQGLLRKGDVLIMDERSHQSLIDGGVLAKARLVFFAHNDVASLAEALEAHKGRRVLVAVEGVYSMDGDLADLPAIVEVCEQYNAPIYLDEAHSSLLFGPNAGGVADHFGLEDRVGLSFGTLSKAFGGMGGFVCGDARVLRYMKTYSSAFVFSCALSPPVVAGCMKALEIATRDDSLRQRLWRNVDRFRRQLGDMKLDLGDSESQIIPIIVGSSAELLFDMAHEVQRRGVYLQPVDYPAVPAATRRFRLSVSASLTDDNIDEACSVIEDVIARRLRG